MKKTKKIFRFLNPKNIGLYLVISAAIWSWSFFYSKVLIARDSITVSGVSYKDVKADKAQWKLSIVSQGNTKKSSYQKLLDDRGLIEQYLTDEGFSLSDLNCGGSDTYAVYKEVDYQKTNEILMYKSSLSCTLKTNDVYAVLNSKNKINVYLIDNNIELSTNDADYIYSNLEEIKVELLEEAVADAKQRAQALSKNTGAKIGKVTQASQGVFQINKKGDYSVSGLGNFNTSHINKTVRATVSVSFEVK